MTTLCCAPQCRLTAAHTRERERARGVTTNVVFAYDWEPAPFRRTNSSSKRRADVLTVGLFLRANNSTSDIFPQLIQLAARRANWGTDICFRVYHIGSVLGFQCEAPPPTRDGAVFVVSTRNTRTRSLPRPE